jgi:hypothetical protein
MFPVLVAVTSSSPVVNDKPDGVSGVNVSVSPSDDRVYRILLVSTGQFVPLRHNPVNGSLVVPAVIVSPLEVLVVKVA